LEGKNEPFCLIGRPGSLRLVESLGMSLSLVYRQRLFVLLVVVRDAAKLGALGQ
jgi:hypothetical protein